MATIQRPEAAGKSMEETLRILQKYLDGRHGYEGPERDSDTYDVGGIYERGTNNRNPNMRYASDGTPNPDRRIRER